MSNLTIDYLENTSGSVNIPVRDLKTRVIQYYQQEYTGGDWNPDNNYNWIPGGFRDFTPRRSDTRIKYTFRAATAWRNASHAISHMRFLANNVQFYTWSESGTHYENGKSWEFEVPSWGTNQARIGIQMRSYAVNNHTVRMHTTYYWDGTASFQNSRGHLMIEEILY